ncbi:unnamed protein product, partial [Staurois parvus]
MFFIRKQIQCFNRCKCEGTVRELSEIAELSADTLFAVLEYFFFSFFFSFFSFFFSFFFLF